LLLLIYQGNQANPIHPGSDKQHELRNSLLSFFTPFLNSLDFLFLFFKKKENSNFIFICCLFAGRPKRCFLLPLPINRFLPGPFYVDFRSTPVHIFFCCILHVLIRLFFSLSSLATLFRVYVFP